MLEKDKIERLKNLSPVELGKIRVAHEQNKREAFDAMRAYHNSELSHKKDAIDILKTILTSSVLIYAGLVASLDNRIANDQSMITLGWALGLIIAISTISITWTTILKIKEDNKRYRQFKAEYIRERELIGLDDDLEAIGHQTHWKKIINENKTGYSYTNLILIWLAIMIVLIGFFGSLVLQEAIKAKNQMGA